MGNFQSSLARLKRRFPLVKVDDGPPPVFERAFELPERAVAALTPTELARIIIGLTARGRVFGKAVATYTEILKRNPPYVQGQTKERVRDYVTVTKLDVGNLSDVVNELADETGRRGLPPIVVPRP